MLDEGVALGIDMDVMHIASFSEHDAVVAGVGIAALIRDTIVAQSKSKASLWEEAPKREGSRAMLRFRGEEN
jgi:hypothetical protein